MKQRDPADMRESLITQSDALEGFPNAGMIQVGCMIAAGLFAIAAELRANREQKT